MKTIETLVDPQRTIFFRIGPYYIDALTDVFGAFNKWQTDRTGSTYSDLSSNLQIPNYLLVLLQCGAPKGCQIGL